MTALAKRAVACKGWRWLPGIRIQGKAGARCIAASASDGRQGWAWADGETARIGNVVDVPDLDDPATLGCLLALVSEAHNDPLAWVQPTVVPGSVRLSVRWRVMLAEGAHGEQVASATGPFGESDRVRSEALVAALEAAP